MGSMMRRTLMWGLPIAAGYAWKRVRGRNARGRAERQPAAG
jgi:hypothetical protein